MNLQYVKRFVNERVTTRVLLVLIFFCSLSYFSGSWLLFFLLLPLYWQMYLKKDLMPSWW